MNDGQVKVAQMGVGVSDWMDGRIPIDFTHNPMTKVDLKVAETQTKLKEAIVSLGGKEAIQNGGGFNQSSEDKATGRQDLDELAADGNRIAAAIAEETQKPSVMDRFRMPHGNGDEALKTAVRAMGKAVTDLGLENDFEAHGMANAATTFSDAADAFEKDEGGQNTALAKQAGATVAIKDLMKDIKAAKKTYNAICYIQYKADAESLAQWKSVSHVEKVPVKKKNGNGATPPP